VKRSEAIAIGQSHSPLVDYVRPLPDVDQAVGEALAESRRHYLAFAPDLVVLFFPDHFNGFFYDLMPPFCIGAAGRTIGDYGTLAGPVRIDERLAEACAQYVLNAGFDIALSYDMVMDHGAAQPLANLGGALDSVDVLPVFLNSVAVPLAPMSRIVGLGRAIGEFARTLDQRVSRPARNVDARTQSVNGTTKRETKPGDIGRRSICKTWRRPYWHPRSQSWMG
jgi:2,3-dihydroxyphenylpropionate 1,2-dioxygenase